MARTWWVGGVGVGTVVVAATLLVGCGGSGSRSSSLAAVEGSGQVRAAPAPAAANPSAAPSAPVQQRPVVVTATLDLTASNVAATAERARAVAEQVGGRVDGDDRASAQSGDTADLVLRVPTAAVSDVFRELDALGRETGRQVHGEDKTAPRADLNARTAALTTSVARLRDLMSRAGTIGDLTALETQLTARESDLESLQAQQRALADQIDLATITVHLTAPGAPAPHPRATQPTGFGAAFLGGGRALLVALRWTLAGLGYSGPVILLAAAVGYVLWLRRRRVPAASR